MLERRLSITIEVCTGGRVIGAVYLSLYLYAIQIDHFKAGMTLQ